MCNTFTVHCLPWEFCAPLVEAFRLEASYRHFISHVDALPDLKDANLRHAIAIDRQGKVIGAARLRADRSIDRLAVIPHEYQSRITSALKEILHDYAESKIAER